MPVRTKMRRIKEEVPVSIGKQNPKLFLVSKGTAALIVSLIEQYEATDGETKPWRESMKVLIGKYTEAGAALKGARLKEGLSQSELARRLGIPPSNICEMENGKRPIGKNMSHRLSELLNIGYKVFL